MTDALAKSYDEAPYDAKPRYATHPDCLATLAVILGMTPAPPDRCRYLELGCSTGGNLLPMAESLPNSSFTGIDLSSVQIDAGRKVASALGLANLHLEGRSILDLDESFGQFDYIVAHGVYSWVPEAVRDKLLWACKHLLAPSGIAYVSYNTLPGFYLRMPAREMMNFHVRGLDEAPEKARQGRMLLEFIARSAASAENTWAKMLADEAELIRPHADYYLLHEHFEPDNHPVYFHQFMSHAGRHGLKYLGEAANHTNPGAYPPEVQEVLRRISPDLMHLEQYLDFIKGRTFRRTLLVHDDIALNRAPTASAVANLLVTGAAKPVSEQPEIASNKVEEFRNEDGIDVATNVPISKAALVELYECWPEAVPFADLLARALARLGTTAIPVNQAREFLGRSLIQLYISSLAALQVHVPSFTTQVSPRPLATPLTRLQAKTGAIVCNRRHRQVDLNGFDRAVLARLDGTRDRNAMLESLLAAVASGDLNIQQGDQPLTDAQTVRALIVAELEPSLDRLAHAAVLIG